VKLTFPIARAFQSDFTATFYKRTGLGAHAVYISHESSEVTLPPSRINSFKMAQPRRTPTVWDALPQAPLVDPSSFIGKKPSKTIPVPPEYRRHTLARERDTLVYDILVEANCHVVPHWDQGKIKSFDIHGTGHSLEKAVTRINLWIASAHIKSKESSAWAKLPAHDPNKWYYDRVEEKEHESKQRYKGPIPLPDDPDAPKYAVG
jgi:hypothetical protein